MKFSPKMTSKIDASYHCFRYNSLVIASVIFRVLTKKLVATKLTTGADDGSDLKAELQSFHAAGFPILIETLPKNTPAMTKLWLLSQEHVVVETESS